MGTDFHKPETGPTLRTFLAVDLPNPLKSELSRLQPAFAPHASALKWTEENLFHITVRFLGDVGVPRMADVEAAAEYSASRVSPFQLRLSQLGAFPNKRTPRVVWVGLDRGPGYDQLSKLFHFAEFELRARGFTGEDRAFSPHITLARAREKSSARDRRAIGDTLQRLIMKNVDWEAFDVRELIVMRSDLSHAGPTYTPIVNVPLRRRCGSEHEGCPRK